MAAFAACTDDYTDWATPQANEPEDPQTVEVTVGEVEPIDFATLVTTNDSVLPTRSTGLWPALQ